MKKIIFIAVLFAAFLGKAYTQEPQVSEWKGKPEIKLPELSAAPVVISNQQIMDIAGDDGSGFFTTLDTVLNVPVFQCKNFFFAFTDSSLTGADSIRVYVKLKSGGVTYYAPISVHDLAQTTRTTDAVWMTAGNGASVIYMFSLATFAGANQLFTGIIHIARQNTRTGEAAYANKTRYNWWWE